MFQAWKTLKYILAGFCAGMTLWHVREEIKHLMHAGHGEHKEGEAKEGQAVKPDEKPVTGGAPVPAAA